MYLGTLSSIWQHQPWSSQAPTMHDVPGIEILNIYFGTYVPTRTSEHQENRAKETGRSPPAFRCILHFHTALPFALPIHVKCMEGTQAVIRRYVVGRFSKPVWSRSNLNNSRGRSVPTYVYSKDMYLWVMASGGIVEASKVPSKL